jgi:hypothetical protein
MLILFVLLTPNPILMNESNSYTCSFAEALAARRKAALQAAAATAAAAANGGGGGGGSAARRKNSRERRESEVMVPWADVNADITCEHGGLKPLARSGSSGGSSNGSGGGSLSLSGSGGGGGSLGGLIMGKRRLVEKRAWKVGG